jgi:uncharacterized membrane protein YfcA
MTLPIDGFELAIALVVALVGATVQGALGFGLAIIGAPILLMVDEVFVPGSLLVSAFLLSLLMIAREREHVRVDEVLLATFGRALTIVPAAAMVRYLPTHLFNTVFACSVLMAVALSMKGLQIPLTRRNIVRAGAVSGVTGTIASIGGPPIALVYQNEQGAHFRATLSAIFTLGTVMSMAGLAAFGKFGMDDIAIGLALMPAVLVGFGLSSVVTRRMGDRSLRPAVLVTSAASAVLVLLKTLWPTAN